MYKVGDKFIVEVKYINCGALPYQIGSDAITKMTSEEFLNFLQPYEPPAPVVWRDGAVEQPDTSREWYYIEKDKAKAGDSWIAYTHIGYIGISIDKLFWFYASEFPMPALPEPQIEPCPFCGGECMLQSEIGRA